jgi:hypothetical protein
MLNRIIARRGPHWYVFRLSGILITRPATHRQSFAQSRVTHLLSYFLTSSLSAFDKLHPRQKRAGSRESKRNGKYFDERLIVHLLIDWTASQKGSQNCGWQCQRSSEEELKAQDQGGRCHRNAKGRNGLTIGQPPIARDEDEMSVDESPAARSKPAKQPVSIAANWTTSGSKR